MKSAIDRQIIALTDQALVELMPANVVKIFDAADYDAQIARASEKLRGGGVVVLPTETVYGAAGALDRTYAVA